MYDTKYKIIIQSDMFSNGLGTSLIEKYIPEEIKTAWCAKHHELRELGKMVEINDYKYWIQIIHDRNNSSDLFIKAEIKL